MPLAIRDTDAVGWESVQLRTPRLMLRPITAADVDDLAAVYDHPDVSRFLRPLDRDGTATQVARFVEEWHEHGFGIFAVLDLMFGRFLGRSGLHYWPQFDEVEVGWVMRRDAWGQGYATEAGAASLEWGFTERSLSLVTAIIARGNAASIAVARRLGMSVLREDDIYGTPCFVFGKSAATDRESP